MSVLPIRIYPDPILKKKARPTNKITDSERKLLEDMAQTMYQAKGVGLAAPQVGVDLKVIVADIGEGLIKVVNPKIVERSGKDIMEEGCLSVPEVCVNVRRPAKITVEGLNDKGENTTIKTEGLLARVLQHEIDHLDGVLIIDHLNPLKRALIKRKLRAKAEFVCEPTTKKL